MLVRLTRSSPALLLTLFVVPVALLAVACVWIDSQPSSPPTTSASIEVEIPDAVLTPARIGSHLAGEASPGAFIPGGEGAIGERYDYWSGPDGVHVTSQMGLLGYDEVDNSREVHLAFEQEDLVLRRWSFIGQGSTLVAVLVAAKKFEVQVLVDGSVQRTWSFDHHRPWMMPVTHLTYVDGYLAVQGALDSQPAETTHRLDVYDVATGELVTRRHMPAPAPHFKPWNWPQSTLERTESCYQEGPARGCVGEKSTVHFRGRELRIERSWPTAADVECRIDLTDTLAHELRVEHRSTDVIVHGRNNATLYTWQYGLDCRLLASREVPTDALESWSVGFGSLPLVARVRASLKGVYFETAEQCGANCTLRVFEPEVDRTSSHNLVSPIGVTTGYSNDYVWWTYHNTKDWYVYVVDRWTRELVFSEMGAHHEYMNPVSGLRVDDGYVTIEIGSFLGMGRLPEVETLVYDIESEQLVAIDRRGFP